tara:strand:+ start:1444 stop:2811 length:1368 start_codon:yes stop_codon:yes gene_type:complete
MTKIFGTDGIRCLVNHEPLTVETCLKIAKTVGYLFLKNILSNCKTKRVLVCKDTRLSGYLYEPLITTGFVSMGIDVILVGPLPTPSVPLLIKTLRADIGVMITASHNTYEYNGLKFFDSNGFKLNKKFENKIEKIITDSKYYSKIINNTYKTGKALRLEDASGRYSEYLKSALNKNIKMKKFKIILDCANGATYNIAPNLFWELGHEVISINVKPNGININKNCGAVNTKDLSKSITLNKADIGFAFDGDGDRIIIVDEKGNTIDGDKILALFAKYLLKRNKTKLKKIVVSTVMSNLGLENFLKNKLNIKLIKTDVGDINVIKEMQKNKSYLGGEQSGHIILSEYSNTGDGILAALKVLEIMSMVNLKVSKLFNNYKDLPQKKINISYKKMNHKIKTKIKNLSKKNTLIPKGYKSLIRFSGTEPLIRILVEGSNKSKVMVLAENIEKKVKVILEK